MPDSSRTRVAGTPLALTQAAANYWLSRRRVAGSGEHWSRDGRDSSASHVALIDNAGAATVRVE